MLNRPNGTITVTQQPGEESSGMHRPLVVNVSSLARRLLFSEYFVLYLSLIYFLIVWPFVPVLASLGTLGNLSSSMSPLLIVALGQTFVLIVGGIDLSVTSVIALASITGASLMTLDGGLLAGTPLAAPAAIGAMIAVGLLVGLLNGLSVSRLHMPPFVATLAAMMFLSGFAVWITQSQNIYNLPPGFIALGQSSLYFVPYPVLIAVGIALVAQLFLAKSLYGQWLYAVGHNARASLVSGVPTWRVITAAYVISGGCAAAASVLYTARLETGSPILGEKLLLDIIGAAVIGGNSLFGGKGKVIWTVFGVFFITLVDNSLNLLGLSYFAILMIKGGVILLAALLDTARNTWSQRNLQ